MSAVSRHCEDAKQQRKKQTFFSTENILITFLLRHRGNFTEAPTVWRWRQMRRLWRKMYKNDISATRSLLFLQFSIARCANKRFQFTFISSRQLSLSRFVIYNGNDDDDDDDEHSWNWKSVDRCNYESLICIEVKTKSVRRWAKGKNDWEILTTKHIEDYVNWIMWTKSKNGQSE